MAKSKAKHKEFKEQCEHLKQSLWTFIARHDGVPLRVDVWSAKKKGGKGLKPNLHATVVFEYLRQVVRIDNARGKHMERIINQKMNELQGEFLATSLVQGNEERVEQRLQPNDWLHLRVVFRGLSVVPNKLEVTEALAQGLKPHMAEGWEFEVDMCTISFLGFDLAGSGQDRSPDVDLCRGGDTQSAPSGTTAPADGDVQTDEGKES